MASNDPPRVARPAGGSLSGFRLVFGRPPVFRHLSGDVTFSQMCKLCLTEALEGSFSKYHVQNQAFPLLASSR